MTYHLYANCSKSPIHVVMTCSNGSGGTLYFRMYVAVYCGHAEAWIYLIVKGFTQEMSGHLVGMFIMLAPPLG